VAYERVVVHAFRLPHVVDTFRLLHDPQPPASIVAAAKPKRRGRLKTVAGIIIIIISVIVVTKFTATIIQGTLKPL